MYKLILFITLILLLIFQADSSSHRHLKYNSCCSDRANHIHHDTCHKTRTPSFKTCRTHNNIVKEINGGTVRYVVNGTYRVCTDPQRRRAVSENYGWNWTRTSPYYKKVPIYLEERPSRSRYGYTEDEYTHSRRRAQRSYHYW
ncbi:MAG: hypothetical protein VX619_10950 [bacterium]|nr:hypothetical protein [bacterium]